MVSGALVKISRLCPHMFFVMQIRVIFAVPSRLWCPLPWCPGQGLTEFAGLDIDGLDKGGPDIDGLDIDGLDIAGLDRDGRMCAQALILNINT